MKQPRFLAAPLTALGFFMVGLPLLDNLLQAWPVKFGNVEWRFGFLGLLSGSLFLVLIGLAFLFMAAMQTEDPRKVNAVSWLSLFGAVCVIVVMIGFSLDTLQMLSRVRPSMKASFLHTCLSTLVRDVLATGVLVTFWVGARRAARDLAGPKTRDSKDGMLARPAMVRPAPPVALSATPSAPIVSAED